ncbi:NAD(P)-dependent oxidoreductase [Mesorhizobium sp. 8]|jgi:3-hydroxyisobutyrate dehydrogenase-like beta-hydroxyacid dehydrogenase|uniref:NAD(P)-dependent oxidoreductase n=1 Tax=Mesorhizobium sp. 8 TaxID=2584466 RepID=UPI00111E61F3|nr:NAD(P)-dependent oxidoreductase [Mesorhizobium sp. 8]QDC02747.1 NAD(P)-dependent oxidoreductase [Mesorhizobium sp. 8]
MSGRTRIGFIGLGMMGHGMARNLVAKGFPLTVVAHRRREAVDDLVSLGAAETTTPAEVAAASDIVFICVGNSAQVETLVRDRSGLAAGAHRGLTIVDCSTSDPNSTLMLAAELMPLGVDYADAPLSRTPKEAMEGTLDCMVGAADAVFARIEPAISAWAGRIVHVGKVGDGHKMKLLNNFVSLGYAAIYAEALALARKSDIEPATFDSVIRGGRMDCGFYQTFMRYVLERDENAHKFSIGNAAKDLRYLEAMADATAFANPVGNAVKNTFAGAAATGRANHYVPMISDIVAAANGTRLD